MGEKAGVEVKSGVAETGAVGVWGAVLGEGERGAGMGVTVWQAVMRMRHPIRRIFFMALFITQLSTTKRRTSERDIPN